MICVLFVATRRRSRPDVAMGFKDGAFCHLLWQPSAASSGLWESIVDGKVARVPPFIIYYVGSGKVEGRFLPFFASSFSGSENSPNYSKASM